jgi:DNA-3-methyladenine glycosylase I
MEEAPAKQRCAWVSIGDEDYRKYHDEEWGSPMHDDRRLFELLILEGMQAGLSWATVLRKRQNFRKAFDGFDFRKVAKYDAKKVRSLLNDPGIIRNRLKIRSAIANAKAFLEIRKEFGTFDKYIWGFVKGNPVVNNFKSVKELPARTDLSDLIAKDLKSRGMTFVGSTIMYAYLQSAGLVNDHTIDCFRHHDLQVQAAFASANLM